MLLVNRMMTDEVVGLPPAEGEALLQELFAHLEAPEIVYRHAWRPDDLVIWDNRALQHARMNFDPAQKRVLRRIPIGEAVAAQAA